MVGGGCVGGNKREERAARSEVEILDVSIHPLLFVGGGSTGRQIEMTDPFSFFMGAPWHRKMKSVLLYERDRGRRATKKGAEGG